jgi:pimeloyl-ACP methyl ester carboxylesterase
MLTALLRRPTLAALLLTLLACAPARADLLFFRDGFILQGKVKRQSITEFDPVSKEPFLLPRGFFLLDDGPRRVYFSPARVRIAERMPAPIEERISHPAPITSIVRPKYPPVILQAFDAKWDSKWCRVLPFRSPSGRWKILQHLGLLTPSYARVDALKTYAWSEAYLTRELGPAVVYKLLRAHPYLQDDYMPPKPPPPRIKGGKKGKKPAKKEKPAQKGKLVKVARKPKRAKPTPDMIANRRLRIIDFLAQAGFYDLADQELTRLEDDVEGQQKRVAAMRKTVAKLKARDHFEQIKRWQQAGRRAAVRKALAAFPEKMLSEHGLAALREMKSADERAQERIKLADRYLAACAKEVKDAAHKPLAAAAAVIRSELHPWGVERLDAFIGQARQAERRRAAKRKSTTGPAELLALAVSGWLLGSPSAEARPDAALALWQTRTMVLDYWRTGEPDERAKILSDYRKKVKTRVELDEVAQMIPHLPPPEPAKDTDTKITARKLQRGRRGPTYHVQLPPEYSHNRPYPVLVVLADADEKPADMLKRWSAVAAENGYILAAPDWEQAGNAGTYQFTEAEHDTVLDALRDLRRRYRVDADRIFLFGLREGGKMALDVGLQHPGQFAGVLTMGTGPIAFPARCWRNAQYLPMYLVNGTRAGDSATHLRNVFDNWLPRSYPALWVEYKGRGQEWFGGELPTMIDWMQRQERVFPMRRLGSDGLGSNSGNEFHTLRAENNRFYWLSATEVNPRNTIRKRWSNSVSPASLTGRIDPNTNEINIKTFGVRRLTVWLGRNARGNYMVDLEKKVIIRIGFRAYWARKVKPRLDVLLEDLHERGDRQQLFVAKVELKLR